MGKAPLNVEDATTFVDTCTEMGDTCTIQDAQDFADELTEAQIARLRLILLWIRIHGG